MNTRIGPSPTGDLHIGTARTAYFNWLAARSTGGSFMLRIDDTDAARNRKEHIDVILETMSWLGLDYDKIVYQSHRYDRYREVAATLPTKVLDGGAIALDISPADCLTNWHDEIAGDIAISDNDNEVLKNMVLIKSDGSPTYNFCTVVDDNDFAIDYIIRGVDHISNTSKQVTLFKLLKASVPKFAHVGLICLANKPLSKRDGAASMLKYRDDGFNPDAMLNFLARMGWGPTEDNKATATLSKDKMLELFWKGGKMRSAPSGLDRLKLDSFDRKYKAMVEKNARSNNS
jgi:glutamyl-tRNA synthetase